MSEVKKCLSVDEILGILYLNSTDECDDGKWIEEENYVNVAQSIHAELPPDQSSVMMKAINKITELASRNSQLYGLVEKLKRELIQEKHSFQYAVDLRDEALNRAETAEAKVKVQGDFVKELYRDITFALANPPDNDTEVLVNLCTKIEALKDTP